MVFDRYQELVDLFAPEAKSILKTDCYNEGHGRPLIKGDLVSKTWMVEYEPKHIDLALKANPSLKILQGDIRNSEYIHNAAKIGFSNYFDLILDFSTIDHVPQFYLEDVFENYRNMLRNGGKLVIVSWFNKNSSNHAESSKGSVYRWKPTDQYFFDYGDFVTDLRSRLNIISEKVIADETNAPAPEGCYIKEFVCQK